MIPYGRQLISEEDIQAVAEALRSDYLTQGPMVPRFERAISDMCGVRFSVATNSGTSALHLSCLALELGPGDLLWTSPITFVASANCALFCGADVDFVDIDADTFNMSIKFLSEKLERAERIGRLPKVVMPVHFAGQPCDLREMNALKSRYGFRVLEDASHALGARYSSNVIGDCAHSDVVAFSFHPVKIITTGEGGAALTNNEKLADKMSLLRSHGITRDPKKMDSPLHGPWYYQQKDLGFNYRMTDIQAALGISQLKRLDEFIQRREAIARRYDDAFSTLPIQTPARKRDIQSANHLYVITLPPSGDPEKRLSVFKELRAKGIGVNVHYIPVHTQPFFQKLGFKIGDFPVAESYYERAISLPIHPGLTETEQNHVISAVANSLR